MSISCFVLLNLRAKDNMRNVNNTGNTKRGQFDPPRYSQFYLKSVRMFRESEVCNHMEASNCDVLIVKPLLEDNPIRKDEEYTKSTIQDLIDFAMINILKIYHVFTNSFIIIILISTYYCLNLVSLSL